MVGYKRNRLKELWWNRPWVYIQEVIRMMKIIPWSNSSGAKFRIWFRNVLYLSWQTCLERMEDG